MTLDEYISASVGIEIPENSINVICLDRGQDPKVEVNIISQRVRELCVADALRWACTVPYSSGSVEDSDAGWKHSSKGTIIDRRTKDMWRKMADEIYSRYGEKKLNTGFKINRL